MCYVVQLFLRHLRLSPGNGVEDGGIGAADAIRVRKLPQSGRLQLLAHAVEVHSIAYYASIGIDVMA
jgi:hypothetical protein